MTSEISGEPLHTRCLAIAFSQGTGASIDFRADIFDLRKSGLMELAGRIASAGIIHKMELHGAFCGESGRLDRIEWSQSHVMHEANRSTKGECCRDPMGRLTDLVGAPLGEGFAAELKRRFGGPLGCTHVSTLFQELSAFAARFRGVLRERPDLVPGRVPGERLARRSVFFDAFLPDDAPTTTRIGVRLSDFFFAAREASDGETMLRHDEVRVVADAELSTWQLRSLGGRERSRQGPTCDAAPWQSRDDALREFATQSLRGGIMRAFLARFSERAEDACLLSALLSLAPGMTQVGAALSDVLVPSSSARPGGFGSSGPGPCYMLRSDGPLIESLFGRDANAAGGADSNRS
jgi:hypothetical protein